MLGLVFYRTGGRGSSLLDGVPARDEVSSGRNPTANDVGATTSLITTESSFTFTCHPGKVRAWAVRGGCEPDASPPDHARRALVNGASDPRNQLLTQSGWSHGRVARGLAWLIVLICFPLAAISVWRPALAPYCMLLAYTVLATIWFRIVFLTTRHPA